MIELLGPPRISGDGGPRPLRLRPKALALLARVALSDRPVGRSALAAELFGDSEDPRGALRWHLAYLRRALPAGAHESVAAAGDTVALELETDVQLFQSLLPGALADPAGDAARTAVEIYRGDLCDGMRVSASATFDGWLYIEQERLRREFRRLVLARTRACLSAGRPADALPGVSQLVQSDPFLEDAHVLLIECFEAGGDLPQSRRAYDRYQRMVRNELGAQPRPSIAARFGDSIDGRGLPADDLIPLPRLTMHVADWAGEGRSILVIHGSGMGAYQMSALAEQLSPHARIVAMDLRGHGESDKPRQGYELADHVADLQELIAELGLVRPVVLGYSIGGAVATALAAASDSRGLILLEGVVGDRAFIDGASLVAERVGRTLDLRYTGIEEYLSAWQTSPPQWSGYALGLAERLAKMDLARLPDGTYRRRALRDALDRLWSSAAASDTLGMLSRVRCPVLLVRAGRRWIGDRPYFSPEATEAQRRACRRATVFVALDSDHATLARDPEPGMIEAIERFLATV